MNYYLYQSTRALNIRRKFKPGMWAPGHFFVVTQMQCVGRNRGLAQHFDGGRAARSATRVALSATLIASRACCGWLAPIAF